MDFVKSRNFAAWVVPVTCAVLFFALIAFVIPYSASQYNTKLSLAHLVRKMAAFGQSDNAAHASLDFTYCLFVPLIFGYLVYLRWGDLRKAQIEGSNIGLGVLILGLLVYWFGMRAENQYFGYAALQIFLAGVILFLWGPAVFRILVFPWAFFIFTWPMPFLDPIIAFPLRMVMSTMAGHLLPMLGVPTLQSGTALLSAPDIVHSIPAGASFQIDIADPCSGIRSLFALLMFSALFGYLMLPKLWQQWTIFLSAFPVAILGNLVRVLLLVFGSIWFGSAFAIGTSDIPSTYHEGCGFLVYGVALGIEFFLASLLTRKWGRSADDEAPSHEEEEPEAN